MNTKQNTTFNYGDGWTRHELDIFEQQLNHVPFAQWPKTRPRDWFRLRGCGYKTLEKIQQAGWCEKRAIMPKQIETVAVFFGLDFFVTQDEADMLKVKVRNAIMAGELGCSRKPRGYGKHRHKIVCEWCGAIYGWPEKSKWVFSPWTGKRLKP